MPNKNEDWSEVSIAFHQFKNEGDELTGELVDKDVITMRKGDNETEVGKYTVVDSKGQKTAFLGGVQLDQLMSDIDIGTTIKVVYVGKQRTGSGYDVKTYKLYAKK